MIKKIPETPTTEEQRRLDSAHVEYQGPEEGPFHCGHCRYFDARRSRCKHTEVLAPVAAGGCCDRYQKIGSDA